MLLDLAVVPLFDENVPPNYGIFKVPFPRVEFHLGVCIHVDVGPLCEP